MDPFNVQLVRAHAHAHVRTGLTKAKLRSVNATAQPPTPTLLSAQSLDRTSADALRSTVTKAVQAALADAATAVTADADAAVALEKARPPKAGIVAPTPPPKPLAERIVQPMSWA